MDYATTNTGAGYDRTMFKQKCDNFYDLAVAHAMRGQK
jgi:hypothetical protein